MMVYKVVFVKNDKQAYPQTVEKYVSAHTILAAAEGATSVFTMSGMYKHIESISIAGEEL